MQTFGVWSQNLRGARPRGVGRVAREISGQLFAADSDNCRYFLVHEAVWRAGVFLFEVEPISASEELQPSPLSGVKDRRFEPAAFFDAILSFECFEEIWEWPLQQYGVKTACVIYDLIPFRINEHYSSEGATRYFKALSRVIGAADALICISKSTFSDLIAFFPQAEIKAHTSYIGYGSSTLRDRRGNVTGPRDETRPATILMVGTVERRKNFHTVLSAVPEIARGLGERPLQIVFAGDSGGRAELVRHHDLAFARASAAAELVFVDFVPDEVLATLYQQADVVIFPSLWEGFGIPILEALSFGVAVVASGLSSHPEVGRSHVRYCDPYVPADIAAKVLEVFRASEERRIWGSARGRLWASRFGWNRAARDYQRILSGLPDGRTEDLAFVREVSEEVYPPACPREVMEAYYLPLAQLVPSRTIAARALLALVRKCARNGGTCAALVFVADPTGPGIEALDAVLDAIRDAMRDRPLVPVGVAIVGGPDVLSRAQLSLVETLAQLGRNSFEEDGASALAQSSGWPVARRAITVDLQSLSHVPLDRYESATVLDPDETGAGNYKAENRIEPVPACAIHDLIVDLDLLKATEAWAFRQIVMDQKLARAARRRKPAGPGQIASPAPRLATCEAIERYWSVLVVEDGLQNATSSGVSARSEAFRLPTLSVHLNPELPVEDTRSILLSDRECLRLLIHRSKVVIGGASTIGGLDDDLFLAASLGKRVILVGHQLDHLAEAVFDVAIAPDLASALALAENALADPGGSQRSEFDYIPGSAGLISHLEVLKAGETLSLDALADAWLLVRRRGMPELLDRLVHLGVLDRGAAERVENAVRALSPAELLTVSDMIRDHLWARLKTRDFFALDEDCEAVSAASWQVPPRDLDFLGSARQWLRTGGSQGVITAGFACSPELTFAIEPATAADQLRCEVDGVVRPTSWIFGGGSPERRTWVQDVRLTHPSGLQKAEQVALTIDLKGATDAVSGDRAISLSGFHPLEYNDRGAPSHRWSGPGLHSRILIPAFIKASCEVRVCIVHLGANERPEQITVSANGVVALIEAGSGDFVVYLSPPKEPIPMIAIHMTVQHILGPEFDTRSIGVAVGRISIRAVTDISSRVEPTNGLSETVLM